MHIQQYMTMKRQTSDEQARKGVFWITFLGGKAHKNVRTEEHEREQV